MIKEDIELRYVIISYSYHATAFYLGRELIQIRRPKQAIVGGVKTFVSVQKCRRLFFPILSTNPKVPKIYSFVDVDSILVLCVNEGSHHTNPVTPVSLPHLLLIGRNKELFKVPASKS